MLVLASDVVRLAISGIEDCRRYIQPSFKYPYLQGLIGIKIKHQPLPACISHDSLPLGV